MTTLDHVTSGPEPAQARPPALAVARLAANVVMERMSRAQRPRVPEPMVMDDPASVAAFHAADPVLQLPMYRFNALAMSALLPDRGRILDLGSGSGRLLSRLAAARPDVHAVGTDLADNMLTAGRASLRDDGLADRVELRKADITRLPPELPPEIDLVSTAWALHHLPTEAHLHRCLAEIARIRETTGCAVWVFDFRTASSPGHLRSDRRDEPTSAGAPTPRRHRQRASRVVAARPARRLQPGRVGRSPRRPRTAHRRPTGLLRAAPRWPSKRTRHALVSP
jgi:SAM-dependent methyltransferase